MADQTPGNAKAAAAILAGALTTIIIYFLNTYALTQPLPAEVVGSIQTVITTIAVYFTPHQIGGSS